MRHGNISTSTWKPTPGRGATPATARTLNTTDYAVNAGSVEVPAGAVTQNTTLSYYPLVASAYAAPQGKTLVGRSG